MLKEFNMLDVSEEARLIAVLKGNYLARWFPAIWRQQVEAKFRKNA